MRTYIKKDHDSFQQNDGAVSKKRIILIIITVEKEEKFTDDYVLTGEIKIIRAICNIVYGKDEEINNRER